MPAYGAVSFLIFFGSMGLPGLCGFIAEVFVVLSAFNYSPVLAVLAAAAVILTAGYILWTLQRVFLGRSEQYKGLPDLTLREWIVSIPLVVLTVALGVFPQSLLLKLDGPVGGADGPIGRDRHLPAGWCRAGPTGSNPGPLRTRHAHRAVAIRADPVEWDERSRGPPDELVYRR